MLADTSVWIDHLRRGNATLARFLDDGSVDCHPFVVGELACGHLRRREEILSLMQRLPHVSVVEHDEALAFLKTHRLFGRGIGWVDAHLLAAAALADVSLWTIDRPLRAAADSLGLSFVP